MRKSLIINDLRARPRPGRKSLARNDLRLGRIYANSAIRRSRSASSAISASDWRAISSATMSASCAAMASACQMSHCASNSARSVSVSSSNKRLVIPITEKSLSESQKKSTINFIFFELVHSFDNDIAKNIHIAPVDVVAFKPIMPSHRILLELFFKVI